MSCESLIMYQVGNGRKLVNKMLLRGLECKCENVTSESLGDVTCDSLGDVTWSHGTHDVRDLSERFADLEWGNHTNRVKTATTPGHVCEGVCTTVISNK